MAPKVMTAVLLLSLALMGAGPADSEAAGRLKMFNSGERILLPGGKPPIPANPEEMTDFLEFFELFEDYGEIIDAEME